MFCSVARIRCVRDLPHYVKRIKYGPTSGNVQKMKTLVRLEYAALFILSVILFSRLPYAW